MTIDPDAVPAPIGPGSAGQTTSPPLATRYTADGRFIETLARPRLAIAHGLEPHPEGGWYRRTWTSEVTVSVAADDGSTRTRPTATLILFLLPAGESSAWHRVTSSETWIWNGLAPVGLDFGGTGPGPVPERRVVLGGDLAAGEQVQVTFPAGVWQRTVVSDRDALASCVVSPGFDFADFSLEQ